MQSTLHDPRSAETSVGTGIAAAAKTPSRSVTDSWMFTHRSWIGAICLAPAGVAVIFSKPWVSEGSPLGVALNIAAWFFFLAYLFMRIWSTLYVGGVKDRVLQTNGPYSITRNPLYVGSICFAISVAFFLKSFTLAALALVAGILYASWVVPAEEKVLESIFGDGYRHYKQRAPRTIPRPALYQAGPTVEVRLRALRTEAKRLLTASLMPIAVFILVHFRAEAWWPHWFRMP